MSLESLKIALHGSYFSANFGDVLLLSIFNKWVRNFCSPSEVVLPFASPEVRHHVGEVAGESGFRSLLRTTSLIYTGGGYFGEDSVRQIRWGFGAIARHAPVGLIAKSLKKPYAIIGVGAGPITNKFTRRIVVELCNNADTLAVRDNESRDYLLEYGVKKGIKVTADAALTLSRSNIPQSKVEQAKLILSRLPQELKLGIHVSQPSTKGEKWRLLFEEIKEFAYKNPNVGLFLLIDHDRAVGQHMATVELNEALPKQSMIVPYEDHQLLTALISEMDLVVTNKLHVGIVSAAVGTSVVSFPFHNKTLRFYKQIEAEQRCIPLKFVERGDIKRQIERYLLNDDTNSLVPGIVRNLAENNRQLLRDFLKKHGHECDLRNTK